MPKTLEQEIQELIAKVQPHWPETIIYDVDKVRAKDLARPIVQAATTTRTTRKKKIEPKPVMDPDINIEELGEPTGIELVRFNKRGKTAVIILDKQVKIILKFPGKKELEGFLSWVG